jgi:hypothetical protein
VSFFDRFENIHEKKPPSPIIRTPNVVKTALSSSRNLFLCSVISKSYMTAEMSYRSVTSPLTADEGCAITALFEGAASAAAAGTHVDVRGEGILLSFEKEVHTL